MRFAATIAAYLSLAVPAIARDFSLDLPVQCTLGETCFVQQYVDHDPSKAARDFTCGTLSYDGHKGTDFGLTSLKAMRQGINALSAAPGRVLGLRDGMPDTGYSAQTAATIAGQECGNGVVIDHGNGWQTQYCHLKKGSVRVRKGETIPAGTVLGQIGLSGKTQFPHLHLSVRKDGKVVDPFNPDGEIACDTAPKDTLWTTPIPYATTGILNIGFSPNIPSFDKIKDGTAPKRISPEDEALVLWVYAFGARPKDKLQLWIDGPGGRLLQKVLTLEKTQAQYFRAVGKRRPAKGFDPGMYQGEIILVRDGQVQASQRIEMELR
jgi:hypothetical protein